MVHTVADDFVREQAALYSLGALNQIEAAAFESHLNSGCLVCRDELADFDSVVGALALASDDIAPRNELRARLLHMVSQVPSVDLPPDSMPIGNGPLAAMSGTGYQPVEGNRAVAWRADTSSSSSSRFLKLALAACLAAIAFLSAGLWRSISENREIRSNLASMSASLDQVRAATRVQEAKAHEFEQISSVLKLPDARLVSLKKKGSGPTSAEVYWDVSHRRWIVTADLPAAPPGKVYQLWFVTAKAPVSAGLIRTDDRGHGYSELELPPELGQLQAAAITLEPEGGSPQPTSEILAIGRVN